MRRVVFSNIDGLILVVMKGTIGGNKQNKTKGGGFGLIHSKLEC